MTIEEKLAAIWAADSSAIALVPQARFKPPGNYQNIARPYVIMYPVGETSTHVHNSAGAIQKLRIWEVFQLSVIADSYITGKAVAEKIRSVFAGNITGTQFFYKGQRWVGRDERVNAEHIAVDLRIAEVLTA